MTWFKKIFFAFTRREKVVFGVALAGTFVSGAILAWFGFIQSTHPVPTSGGEYTEGMLGQPTFINPVIASTEIDKSAVRLVFSNIQDLADKIEISPDGRVWKIRLKENLRWQDGEKLTSDDAIFTVQKIQDRESASPLFRSWQGVAAQRLSELELQFSLVSPYAFFSDTLRGLYVLPKHLFADTPPANWKLSDYNLKPVGSGPYKFLSYEKRPDGFINLYRFEAWDKYFGDKALIKTFNLKFFVQTADAIKDFDSGQIDGLAGLEPENLGQIKRPHEIYPLYLPSYYAVFLNQSKSVPLKELEVRQALAWSIDKEGLVKDALAGHGKVAGGPVPEGTFYFDSGVAVVPPSLELASDTLDKAGWKITPQGFREKTIKTSKIPLALTLTVPQIGFLTKTADMLKDSWGKIGFKINLTTAPPEEITASTIKNRDYEMLLFGNVLGKNTDLFSFWHSSQRFYPGLNLALYNNKKVDSLLESVRQNLDEAGRKAQFSDLQKLIIADYPVVFLYSPEYVFVAEKNLHGVEGGLITEPAERFARTNKWYLKTARVLK